MQSDAALNPDALESSPPTSGTGSRAALREALVIINERSGTAGPVRDALPQLEQALRAAHLEVSTHLVPPDRVRQLLEKKLGEEPTLVVVGGGDGTLRVAASLLAGTEHVLGILPLGTMNRFARSLGIPMDLEGALATLAHGVDQRVDLGEVNGEVFLNTCMLGVYPEIVRVREKRRQQHPSWPRWFRWIVDTALAAWEVSRRRRRFTFRLQLERRALPHRVSAVLVTNNPLPEAEDRRSFDRGLLAIHLPATDRSIDLMSMAIQAARLGPPLAPRLPGAELDVVLTQHARLWTFPRIPISLDAEVRPAQSFLSLKSRPRALRVRAPQAEA
ncbi:MAG TPA: diacylglycerol kinase family protein [Polyangiaceae bacterium]